MSRYPSSPSTRPDRQRAELRLAPIAFAALLAVCGMQANGQPVSNQLPVVRAGSAPVNAAINANTGTGANPVMNITQTQSPSNRGVIEWTSFSIGSAARVNITQPSAQSVLINRVTGPGSGGASEIYGSLNANGRVFLVNPAGVVFGPGAQVNVGSLVATSLDLTPAMTSSNYAGALGADSIDFATVAGAAVEVMNGATITATTGGSVVLVSDAEVRQNGAIEAVQGRITLAGADAAAIVPLGTSGFVDLVIAPNVDFPGLVSVSAGSSTRAAGGSIIIGGTDADKSRSDTLNISGTVSTDSATGGGGSVLIDAGVNGLVSVDSGAQVSASSTAADGRGGDIVLGGNSISLQSANGTTALLANGSAGGGNITVGGADTRALNIGTGTILSADATDNGNGGNILARATYSNLANGSVPRSDYGVTEVYGALRARGGINGGNGGHIETSGTALNTALDSSVTGTISATIDARARATGGLGGSWAIDPFDVTISNSAPTGFSGTYTPTGPGANLRASDISAALDAGTSVEITTGTAAVGTDAGGITLTNGTTISRTAGTSPATLTLRAHDSVILQGNSGIGGTTASPLNVNLFSDLDGNGAGGIDVQSQASISTGGGKLTLSGGIDPATGFAAGGSGTAGVNLNTTSLDTSGAGTARGDVVIRGTAGLAGAGVSAADSSIIGNNIAIVGRATDNSAVALNGVNLSTVSGTIDIRGVSTRSGATSGQSVGVQLSSVQVDLGSGSLIAAGRGDDNGFSGAGAPAVGLQYSDLNINTATGPAGRITLAGEAANSTGPGLTFQDVGSGGLIITAGASAAIPTLADISLGAISAAGLAIDFGIGMGFTTAIKTDGAINIRPLGVDSTGALVESTATPISIATTSSTSTGFIVDPAWLANPDTAAHGFSAGGGVVVGSSQHNAAITVGDNTLTLTDHADLSLTLQNQGTGSGGIQLGSGNALRDLGLLSAGSVNQTGPLAVTGKLVIEGGPASTVNLAQANTIGVLAFDPPATLAVTTQDDLTVDAASIMGYNAATQSFSPLDITGSLAGNAAALQSLAGSVLVNQSITMTGAGATQLDLVSPVAVTIAGGALLNTSVTGRARAWAPTITGMAGSTNYYGCVFGAASCVSGITLPTAGLQAIRDTQPGVTVTANPASGTTGSAIPPLTYTNSALANGDSAAQALAGALSTPATAQSPAGSYAIDQGTLASPTGYLIAYTPGTLTLAAPATPAAPPTSMLNFPLEPVRSEYLSEFRSDVYGRNLSLPFVCTASSLIRDSVAPESKSDPLASEWGKVRHQPQLSGCLDVTSAGQCAAF